jgi:putative ABC transport system permease protein
MNIMLVSVSERKKEIGIRKALGATRGLISFQFIIESIVICSIGGIIAIGLSFLLAMLIDKMTPFPSTVPVWSIFMGLGFSSFVGLFFGIYPARQAAKLNPIDCLHYE